MNVNVNRAIENNKEPTNEESIDKYKSEAQNELFGSLLDLLGTIGGFDPETFADEKEEIINSGVGLENFMSILGESVGDKFGLREIVNLPIQLMTPTAIMPKYAHSTDGCADLYADETITIKPGQTNIIHTGISMAIPEGFVVHIYPRSSTGLKTPLRLANSVGVIDSGYRDEIRVVYTNIGEEPYTIIKGDRIAQMSIDHSPMARFQLVDNVKEIGTDREGGFGSTGVSEMEGTAAQEA